MTPEEAIAGWLRIFAKEFLVNRARDIVQRGLVNSQDLIRSLDAKVTTEPARGLFLMVFFTRIYGRYQDMRRRYNKVGGDEMVADLEKWAETEGLGKFTKKGKRNYPEMYKGQTPERIKNRIAWGIIRKYRDRGTAPKRGWYNRGKERDINTFYDVLLRVWREAVLEQQAKNIRGN